MPHAAFKPSHFKQMLQAAKDRSVSFAFGASESESGDVFVLDSDLDPKALFGKVKSEKGLSKGGYGSCQVRGGSLELRVDKDFQGMKARVNALAKANQWPVKRAKFAGEPDVPGENRGLELDLSPKKPMTEEELIGAETEFDPAAAATVRENFTGKVRASEVIAGASGVQESMGEVTYQAMNDGGDIAEGARRHAAANDREGVVSGYTAGPNAMQSTAGAGNFALRYGIGFLCWDYKTDRLHDLDDVEQLKKPAGKYLAAFKGMARTEQFENPTAREIVQGIGQWIQRLAKALPDQQTGELVVSFQGHGFEGSVYGVDGKRVTPAHLAKLASVGEKQGVSLTYLLDACYSGAATQIFQDHRADGLEAGLAKDDAAGRGALAHAREFIHFSRAINRLARDLTRQAQKFDRLSGREDYFAQVKGLNDEILDLITSMQKQFEANAEFFNRPEFKLGEVRSAFRAMLALLHSISGNESHDVVDWVGAVGKFQDQVGDAANRILEELDSSVNNGSKA